MKIILFKINLLAFFSFLVIFCQTIFSQEGGGFLERFGNVNIGIGRRHRPFGKPGTIGTPIVGSDTEQNQQANRPHRGDMAFKWPDLVGTKADDALLKIQKDRPDVKITIIPQGSMVTTDHRENRVR